MSKNIRRYQPPFPSAKYSEVERETVISHIEKCFGKIEKIQHEFISPYAVVDIAIIPPEKHRKYYVLSTIGAGAYKMRVPKSLKDKKIDRFELTVMLPDSWNVDGRDNNSFWPFHILRMTARIPAYYDTWLGWGYSTDNTEPFYSESELCGMLLSMPKYCPDSNEYTACTLPCGDDVNFYQLIPIYKEELDFKNERGILPIMDLVRFMPPTIVPDRPLVCGPSSEIDYTDAVDAVITHRPKIYDKELKTDEKSAANHIALYLCWCVKHGLVGEDFIENHPDMPSPDDFFGFRDFFIDSLDGVLLLSYLSDAGKEFTKAYYNFIDGSYAADVDNCALEYFGREKCEGPDICDEAYLFAPYDDTYNEKLYSRIDYAYRLFMSDQYSRTGNGGEE